MNNFSSNTVIVSIDIYNLSFLKTIFNEETLKETISKFNNFLSDQFNFFQGTEYYLGDNNTIYLFLSPIDGVNASLYLINNFNEFNYNQNNIEYPLLIKIRINMKPVEANESFFLEYHRNLNNYMENSRFGMITISKEVFDSIGIYQQLFHPYENIITSLSEFSSEEAYVLKNRQFTPQEKTLLEGLSERQKKLIPLIPYTKWNMIAPDEKINLRNFRNYLENQPVLLILGETNTNPEGPIKSSATSDAVGAIELVSLMPNIQALSTIDEWEDTANLVPYSNLIIIGSGASNIYSFAINNLIEPLHFIKTNGRIVDRIQAISNSGIEVFGHHSKGGRDCGLVIIAKSPFNIGKNLIWIAGTTGMGTLAAAMLTCDLIKDQEDALDGLDLIDPIACIAVPYSPIIKMDIHQFYKKRRIPHYKIIWAIGHSSY